MKDYEFFDLCCDGTLNDIRSAINDGADVNARVKSGKCALLAACAHNTPEVVKLLLDAGADPNVQSFEGWTVLMSICDNEEIDLDIIRLLINYGADVNAKNEFDTTPLLRAVCWNHRPDVVRELLEAGVDMHAFGAYGFDYFEYGGGTPLEAAGSIDVLSVFMEFGADVNTRFSDGSTLLTSSAKFNPEMVSFLIAHGADVNVINNNGITPLINAAKHSRTPDIINMLLDAGANPNVTHEGLYALDYARRNYALKGSQALSRLEALTMPATFSGKISPEEFEALIEHASLDRIREAISAGADVNATGQDHHAKGQAPHEPPIIFAIRRRPDPELIRILLDAGGDVNERRGYYSDDTLLVTALTFPQNTYFQRASNDVIRLLLDYGADVNAANDYGVTPSLRACTNRDAECVKMLLDAGADISARTNDGGSPLLSACAYGDIDVIRLLITHGANVNDKNSAGRTALVEVLDDLGPGSATDIDVVKLLLAHGADVNIMASARSLFTPPELMRTPLMMAADMYSPRHYVINNRMVDVDAVPEFVKVLIDAGADINARDTDGMTALMIAAKNRTPNIKVIRILVEAGADVNGEHEGLRAVDYARRNKDAQGTGITEYLQSITAPREVPRRIHYQEMVSLIRDELIDELKDAIACGADVNERDTTDDWTLLMCAVKADGYDNEPAPEIVRLLLDAGADVNARTAFEETPLKKAVYNRYSEHSVAVLNMLIDAGADLNAPNDEGVTPLMSAASSECPDFVKILLSAGADPDLVSNEGMRALDYSLQNEYMRSSQAIHELKARTTPQA